MIIFAEKEEMIMETAIESFYINVPKADIAFLKALVKKMGWTVENKKTILNTKGKEQAESKLNHYEVSPFVRSLQLKDGEEVPAEVDGIDVLISTKYLP